jgi:iron complex outermembrane recepter protein
MEEGGTAGVSVARAFRTPSVEELFSDGPHLADFSYNVGNPDLAAEFGLGVDVFLRVSTPRTQAELTGYRNAVDNYIYYMPTGAIDPRFQRYPVFQARGDDALFQGMEGRVQVEVSPGLVVDGTAAYVRASRRETGDPLPFIPPLNGRFEVRYEAPRYFVNGALRASAAQERVPAPITVPGEQAEPVQPQRPTDGHSLVDLGGGMRWTLGGRLHTLTLKVDNLLDTAWRDHLSRIKDVAPQPGRNLRLLYRVQF